jgi:hypothetical protein
VRLRRAAALALTGFVATGGVAGAATFKANPETDSHRAPDDDAGLFLGYATPTYSWHGCKITSVWVSPAGLPQGAPPLDAGTKPRTVTFTHTSTAPPYVSWKVNSRYKICGAEVMVEMENPTVDSLLYGSAAYTSGKTKGSTATNGRETIKVKIPKGGIGQDFAQFEGKTYSLAQIDGIAVFVKKR